MSESIRDRIADIYAVESRRVLATLIRLLGDFDRAEEALQDAFSAALIAWPRDGIPRNPRSWLVSTGKFKAIDAIRREGRGNELIFERAQEDQRTYVAPEEWDGDFVVEDDQLRLVFTCWHPQLPIDARIALSLRVVCGLTTEEIARSFLVPAETMKKRISRAKTTIRDNQIPYEVPSRSELAGRLDAVLRVVYLVYNEGYSATSGTEHLRRELAAEAVFMCRLIVDLLVKLQDSSVVALNRAIAISMRDGPAAGLAIVEDLLKRTEISNYHLAHAARADLARRAGFLEEARLSYQRAIELFRQEPERRYLERCLTQISD